MILRLQSRLILCLSLPTVMGFTANAVGQKTPPSQSTPTPLIPTQSVPAQTAPVMPAPVRQAAPQPDAKQLVEQVVAHELSLGTADKTQWLYYEQDNKLKLSVIQWVAQTPTADVARVLEVDGQRLSKAQQHEKMEAFLHDRSAQSRDRKKQQEDIKQTVELLKLLPVAFLWSTTSSQDGVSTLHFKPDPSFHPPNAEARILGAVEGDFIVNNSQHRIMSLNGKLLHDVKFGGGLLGEIKSGGTFAIGRKEVIPGEWQITETHVHFAGHMLLFKSVSEQEDDLRDSFKPIPSALTLEQAKTEVLKMGDPLSK